MAFDEAPYARRGRFVCLADATAAVEPAVEANAWAGEELVPALGPVEARGHFIGEPDGLDEEGTGWVKGVAAMAVAAGVGAQEAAVELDGVELLIGLKVGAGRHDAVRGRQLEGREGPVAGDFVAFVFTDVFVAGVFEGFWVSNFFEDFCYFVSISFLIKSFKDSFSCFTCFLSHECFIRPDDIASLLHGSILMLFSSF